VSEENLDQNVAIIDALRRCGADVGMEDIQCGLRSDLNLPYDYRHLGHIAQSSHFMGLRHTKLLVYIELMFGQALVLCHRYEDF
jgi:hypothetical protein